RLVPEGIRGNDAARPPGAHPATAPGDTRRGALGRLTARSSAMTRRQMHLIAYLKTGPTAQHTGGWRHPESTLDDILEPSRYEYIARLLESAKFDGCFFADLFGLYDIHEGSY